MYLNLLWLLLLLSGDITAKNGRAKPPKGTKWWSLANFGQPSNELRSQSTKLYNTPSLLPLTKRQRKLVTKNPGTVMAVVNAAKLAMEECKHQFANRRWRCPAHFDGHGNSVFGQIVQRGCRETAFIYSITSAAVSYSVARACSEGSISTCFCDRAHHSRPTGQDWDWSGCSDNTKFGHRFSRKFVDVLEKGRDFRFMVNLHNNEAGRVHVSSGLREECRCHGMTGSCTIRTCWMKLPYFRTIGSALKDRFDGASRILPGNDGKTAAKGNSARSRRQKKKKRKFHFSPANANHKKPRRRDLVYFEDSPSFCDKDTGIGFLGTVGRECNGTSLGIDGCDLMCCGRGFMSEDYIHKVRCQCKFIWCCEVKCKECTVKKTRHTCL